MLSNIIAITSAVFAILSVLITYLIYKAFRSNASYWDIDKQYSELLKIALDDPDLRDFNKTSMFYKLDSDDSFKKKYHIYANMCWNLVETIYDRQKDEKGRVNSETWMPVMFEENRLHYTWYKHNLRLFKPEFQQFVTSQLNDIEIMEGNINDLKEVYAKIERDFPPDERKDYKHLENLMAKKKYKLLLAKHKVFDEIVGYAFVYEIDNLKVLWLDYIAIDIRYKNAGYGTLLFNKIAELKQEGFIGTFMEVEMPTAEDEISKEVQLRRLKFYERLGAKRLKTHYKLPTNHGGVPMYLYFHPSPNVSVLPKEQIQEIIASVYEYIHTDISNRDSILKTFLSSIEDEFMR